MFHIGSGDSTLWPAYMLADGDLADPQQPHVTECEGAD